MLLSLRIENFALIDRLDLGFTAGLNVLTGETGAGKSIILDALEGVLGGKLTPRAIRTGADRALLEATFTLDLAISTWLAEQSIDPLEDDWLVCSREVSIAQGNLRGRSRVNGVLVNKQQMEQLRHHLVEITAQGQTVQLGQAASQRIWLDSFGGAPLLQQQAIVAQAFTAFQQAQQALESYRHSERQRLQQLDLLEYQVRELQEAALTTADEQNQLEQERQRLSHSVELQQQSYTVYQALYHNEEGAKACADLLGQAQLTLETMQRYDSQVQPILDLVSDALAQVEEAGRQVSAYGETLDTDPQRLQVVEERLAELKHICRKYGPTLAEAIAYRDRIQAELDQLTSQEQSLETLEHNHQATVAALTQACAALTKLRQEAAGQLEARLIQELQPLAMEKVKFQVQLSAIAPTSYGADSISFWFSPNPGEPLQPLAEVASGGEMSRFLLALKACFSQVDPVGTLVFDEIDVGVSGRVAQAIAEKLHHLSQQHQVLCVTHQPMVAAMADSHFRVAKQVVEQPTLPKASAKSKRGQSPLVEPHDQDGADPLGERTIVQISALETLERREELAQLAGGHSAQEAMSFADSLLSQAASLRQRLTQPTPSTSSSKRRKPKSQAGNPSSGS